MDDDKTQGSIAQAVKEYLDTEDEFAAEKLKATGAINKRRDTILSKIIARIAKLDITKEAFKTECKAERHIRSGVNVFRHIDDGEDLVLVGGFSRVALATGTFFEPLYGKEEKAKMESLVEELADATSEDANEGEDTKVHKLQAAE